MVINQKGIDPVALDMFAKEVPPPCLVVSLPRAKSYTPTPTLGWWGWGEGPTLRILLTPQTFFTISTN